MENILIAAVVYGLLWTYFLRKYFITPEKMKRIKHKMRGWF